MLPDVPTSIVVEGVPTELVGTGSHKACGNGIQYEILPPALTKAPLKAGVKKNEPVHFKRPQETQIVNIFPLYKFSLCNENYIVSSQCSTLLGRCPNFNLFLILKRSLGKN